MSDLEDSSSAEVPDTSNLNWGAFGVTPFWLFANGFWASLLAYAALVYISPWLGLPVSVLFLIKGTEWSWGKGHRWKSYEQFAETQAAWTIWGYVGMLGAVAFVALKAAGL
jgi:hypothetical protein